MKKTILLSFAFLMFGMANTKSQQIVTYAGDGYAGYSGDGGSASSAEVNHPVTVSFDAVGNMYIADDLNNRIRKITTSGIISTIAGNGVGAYSGDGGQATAAEIAGPLDVFVDALYNVYVVTNGNSRVRKINTSGIITTFAGNGINAYSGDGGQATAAELNMPYGGIADATGNIYIADQAEHRVRMINTSGIITTVAGNGAVGYSGDGGQATSAELRQPVRLLLDGTGNLYIADYSAATIRKVNTSGVISTVAGKGAIGYTGDGGQATSAELDEPYGIALDNSGKLYISSITDHRVREVNSSGVISELAGNGTGGYSGDGGLSSSAEINKPLKIAIDATGNLFIADDLNSRIREIYLFLAVTETTVNLSCYGSGTGSASVTAIHGTTPYTYSWAPSGGTNSSNSALSIGTYTVYVTDAKGITGNTTFTITRPSLLTASASATTNVSCYGGNNGSVSATQSGGTIPYTYLWNGGGTNLTKTGLSIGTYVVLVTDNNGCTATASVTITQPGQLTVSTDIIHEVTCNGGSNGAAKAEAKGGVTPYTYSWSNGATTSATSGLSAGTYTITLTDANGCTATANVVITQPPAIAPSIVWVNSVHCSGGFDGMALATASSGITPYTYSWAPGGATTDEVTGLSAGTYTVYVTDAHGCTGTTSVNITQPSVLTITSTNIYSIVYAAVTGGTPPYSYTWTPGGSTSAIVTGISAGTYTVVVEDANACIDSAVIVITNNITIPNYSMLNHPRWSKRGVDVEFADTYYYPSDSLTIKGGELADYCFKNHITYVLLGGVYYDPVEAPYGAFNIDSASVDPLYGAALKSLIYMLKTRGHVEQVGVNVYPSDLGFHDTGFYAIKNFNVSNFVNSAFIYNVGLPWVAKLDYLSLDEEFWGDGTYSADSADFYSAHLPMLQLMYKVAHGCDANYIRVEDYIGPPLNNYNPNPNTTQSKEIDSICKYADRILFSSYTQYPSVLWDRNDWVPGWQEIGRNPGNYYYKKEVWPIYDAANLNNTSCDTCIDGSNNAFDFLGDSTCHLHTTSVNMEQRWFYRYFANSMENGVWTPNNTSSILMGSDTCFEILVNAWYQYRCVKKLCHFDTLTYPSSTDTVIPFWISVGHDTNWRSSPILLKANVHGGTPPYAYIWYNDDNGQLLQPPRFSSNNFDTLTVYSTGRVRVLAVDFQDSTALDYLNIYNDTCFGPLAVPTISLPSYVVDLYPNPANNLINIEMAGNIGKQNVVELYNMLGQKVLGDLFSGKKTTIDVSQLRQGAYFYRIVSAGGKEYKSGKIIIVH